VAVIGVLVAPCPNLPKILPFNTSMNGVAATLVA